MVEVGQVIAVDILKDGNEELYFRTEVSEKKNGKKLHTFCRVKNPEEIDFTDFWQMSDEYFDKLEKNGQIRVVERAKDI